MADQTITDTTGDGNGHYAADVTITYRDCTADGTRATLLRELRSLREEITRESVAEEQAEAADGGYDDWYALRYLSPVAIHERAVSLLLKYINDDEVTLAFDAITSRHGAL